MGNNMFAYCNNNPVNCIDPSGRFLLKLIVIVLVSIIVQMPSREEHYNRNKYQENIPYMDPKEITGSSNWEEQDDDKNIYHRHTVGEQGEDAKDNKKYMTKDKKYEVIINFTDANNPKIVTDPYNIGTYNFGAHPIDHVIMDVIPYYIWGNSEVDSGLSFMWDRIVGAPK